MEPGRTASCWRTRLGRISFPDLFSGRTDPQSSPEQLDKYHNHQNDDEESQDEIVDTLTQHDAERAHAPTPAYFTGRLSIPEESGGREGMVGEEDEVGGKDVQAGREGEVFDLTGWESWSCRQGCSLICQTCR